MSFGAAAAGRGRRPPAGAACPCGSGSAFSECCGPVLDGIPAATPESLMRSRYTAFALGDRPHLVRSWHPATRPDPLDLDADTQWLGLTIVGASESGARGTVEFRARWRDAASRTTGELHETSRFRQVAGQWVYLDGEIA